MMRIGLVGQGPSAQTHGRHFAELPDAEVVAVTGDEPPDDTSADAATDDGSVMTDDDSVTAYDDSVTTYDDPVAMYDDADLDAAGVCTPPDQHRTPVIAAAERDLDVFCPGALAGTLADGEAIADAVATAGVVFVGGHVTRFAPEYDRAATRVEDGEIGSVGNVRTFRRDGRRRTDGDPFDLLGLDVEFLRRVCGDVNHAFARRAETDDDAYALATLRFENDVIGHLDVRQDGTNEGGQTRRGGPTRRFELSGTDGLLEFDTESVTPVTLTGTEDEGTTVPLQRDGRRRHVEHFLACLAGEERPAVTAEDALATLRVCTAVRVAADSGTPISPAEVSA